MLTIRLRLFVLAALAAPVVLHAQKLDSVMAIYAEQYPQEKAYLHFDKNIYNPGETIWFKAYLYSGFEPSSISRSFYAELWDAAGNLVQRKTAPLMEGTAIGSFEIPAAFKGTRAHIRAYTTWMLNFDTAFVFEKNIRVNGPETAAPAVAAEPRLEFFPEGGELVGGVENNIAFKATDGAGVPIPVSGSLKDGSGKEILQFASVHDGMGKFLLTPDKSDLFTAFWKDDKGVSHQTAFPVPKVSAVALRAQAARGKVVFSVGRSLDNAATDRVVVLAHMNQQMVYRATVNLKESFMSGGSIPTQQLPSGVLTVTVFDLHDAPLAERVVFVNNHNYRFEADMALSAKSAARRGRNVIDIVVPDTVRANMSLAVTDADADGEKAGDDNIIAHLLVTGDLKGYVHNPGFYFANEADSTAQYLDLVMLTHGWRRFRWDAVSQGRLPVIKFPVQDYLSINADVLGIDPTRIAAGESMNVIMRKKDSSTQMLSVPRLKGNKFGVSGLVFYDTAKLYYMFGVNRNLSQQAAVVMTNGLYPGSRAIRPFPLTVSPWTAADSALIRKNRLVREQNAKNRDEFSKPKMLATVTVKGYTKTPLQKLDEEYSSGLFSGGDASIFDLMNDNLASAYPDIFSYLQGKVAGLQIVTGAGQTSMTWRGGTPQVYLNEMQVDVEQLRSTPVADIAMVKIFRPGSGVGFGGGSGGTIAVYTKKGGARAPDPNVKGLDQFRLPGYSAVRQFYAPDYMQPQETDSTDTRTTLYWNPYILTERGNAKVTVTFYNSDMATRLRVVLEGFNAEGRLTRVEKIIE